MERRAATLLRHTATGNEAQNTSGKGAESTCETIRAIESAGRTAYRMGVAGAPFVAAAVIEILEDPRKMMLGHCTCRIGAHPCTSDCIE